MSIEFKLPEVSDGVTSVDIATIHVKAGDVVTKDQVVMELETEKAVVELPCPQAGRIAKVHVALGQTVEIGSTLLTIEAGNGAAIASAQVTSIPSAKTAAPALAAQPVAPAALPTKKTS